MYPFSIHHTYKAPGAFDRNVEGTGCFFCFSRKEMSMSNELKAYTLQELYAHPMEPICWLVEGLLAPGLYFLGGSPKVGKSWPALQLCLAVCRGESFLGFRTRKSEVLYLALEDGPRRLHARALHLTEETPAGLHLCGHAPLIGQGLEQQLDQMLDEHPGIRLVIIDTLQKVRAVAGANASYGNDYQDAAALKELADHCNVCMLVMLLYLTPEGEDPSDCDNWDVLTYRDIAATLSELQNTMDLAPDVLLVIGNYIDVIRRDIVEDEKLIEVCNKIYAKHKRALDLIFEHRTDGRTQLADGIKATLTTLTEEGVICASPFTSSNTNFFVFRTNEMNHYLPPIDTPTSSWGNEYIYSYWIAIRENQLCGVFEIGGWNVPEQQMQTMQKMIDLLKPGDKRRENFRYKRLFRTGWYKIEENDSFEDSVSDCVRKVVKELLKKETQLLKQMEKAEWTEA